MMRFSTAAILALGLTGLCALPALANDCPAGMYRMLTPNGPVCAPYGDGGPRTPGPGPNRSTITGPSGTGSNGQRGAPAASAR